MHHHRDDDEIVYPVSTDVKIQVGGGLRSK